VSAIKLFSFSLCYTECIIDKINKKYTTVLYIFAYFFVMHSVYAPRLPPGLCPWTPLGTSEPQTSCFVPPLSKFLATPLLVTISDRIKIFINRTFTDGYKSDNLCVSYSQPKINWTKTLHTQVHLGLEHTHTHAPSFGYGLSTGCLKLNASARVYILLNKRCTRLPWRMRLRNYLQGGPKK